MTKLTQTVTVDTRSLLAQLVPLLPKLNLADRTFAESVIASTQRWGGTPGRDKALQSLIDRATGAAPAQQPEQAQVGSFAGVTRLLNRAKRRLQFPKIRLLLPNGNRIVLAFCGPRSQYAGQINVSDGGGFGSKWYGRVSEQGVWTKSGKLHPEEAQQVETMLTQLASKPATTAAEYGRLTGRCCFCNLPLKDELSTAAGYGPKCAENYGLAEQRKEGVPLLDELAEEEQAS